MAIACKMAFVAMNAGMLPGKLQNLRTDPSTAGQMLKYGNIKR